MFLTSILSCYHLLPINGQLEDWAFYQYLLIVNCIIYVQLHQLHDTHQKPHTGTKWAVPIPWPGRFWARLCVVITHVENVYY